MSGLESKWWIYIPEEGDWPIDYEGDDRAEARSVYLRWAERKRLPAGSRIWCSSWSSSEVRS